MADDPNEFDDAEQSYRRGYVHGAPDVRDQLLRMAREWMQAAIEGRRGGLCATFVFWLISYSSSPAAIPSRERRGFARPDKPCR